MNLTHIKRTKFLVFASVPLLVGCSESINDKPYSPSLVSQYLSVNPRNFEFSNNQDSKNGTVRSDAPWSFSDAPSWLTLSPVSGNSNSEFTMTSQANESITNREAILYVTSNIASSQIQKIITASQIGANPYISFPEFSSSTVSIEGKGENMIIAVESNIQDLTASFSQPWGNASYNSETKRISLEIQGNETNVSRDGILTVSSQLYNKTANLTISQLSTGVSVIEGMALEFGADGGSQTRTISSDLAWTAQSSSSWIEFSPTSGDAGETAMTITAFPSYDSDNRTGQIYFYFGDIEKKYIDVKQSGRFITPNVATCNLKAAEGSEARVILNSSIDWEVSSHPEWLTISPMTGDEGETLLTIIAMENKSFDPRSGNIILNDSQSGNVESTIKVIQDGVEYEDETILEFNWKSSLLPLSIPATTQWTATASENWISLSKYSGNGEESIEVSVTRNDSENSRSGKIVISSEGRNLAIPVVQQGQYITLSSTIGEFDWNGGNLDLYVSSSLDTEHKIKYETEEKDWINITSNEKEYTISVLQNNSINTRKATMYILPVDEEANENLSQGIKFIISQYGRSLTINTSEIYMGSSGGTSPEYVIEADGNYKIAKQVATWFSVSVNKITNTFYVTTTENLSGDVRKGLITISLENLPSDETLEKTVTLIQDFRKYQ